MTKQSSNQEMNNFWTELKDKKEKTGEPFFALAPMADVTDTAFRRVIAKYGKPDILWTEFVSADGLVLGGREHLMYDLLYTEAERPIIAQLFGSNPENMKEASKLCAELGFDGIDINMGCPDKSIEKQGAGASMMKNPELAIAVIRSAKQGIALASQKTGKTIPLSVKTRIGYNKNEINTWLPALLAENLSAITIHVRTRKEMSKVPARWEHIEEATKLRDKLSPHTLIIGNGDVESVEHGRQLAKKHGADGVMIGRAIFGNPWLFASLHKVDEENFKKKSNQKLFQKLFRKLIQKPFLKIKTSLGYKNRYWLQDKAEQNISKDEKLRVLVEHCKLYEEHLGGIKNFAVMKKHFKAYVHGWPGAKELRLELMKANSAKDVEEIIKLKK